MLTCAQCGQPMPAKMPDGPQPKYCGRQDCRRALWRAKYHRRMERVRNNQPPVSEIERLLNDFDYVFPDYYQQGEKPWTPPLIILPRQQKATRGRMQVPRVRQIA